MNAGRLSRLLNNAGQSVVWRRAYECPCRDANSNAPLPNCQVCTNGQIYDPPKPATVALCGQKVQDKWATSGRFENGDVVCSIPCDSPVYEISEFDRVLFVDSTVPFSIALTRQTVTTLNFTPEYIDTCFYLDPDASRKIAANIPIVAADGSLRFGAQAPAVGQQFNISGRKHPEYYCYLDLAMDRAHYHGMSLPRKVVLRNFDLFGRST